MADGKKINPHTFSRMNLNEKSSKTHHFTHVSKTQNIQEGVGIKEDKELDSDLFRIARQGGTEAPFSGKYWNNHEKGMYKCAICSTELFTSDKKFDSGTSWPSFTNPVNLEHIILKGDFSHGMRRTEVLCKKCGAHLGHVFDDGPKDKGGKRYCINSACLNFEQVKK